MILNCFGCHFFIIISWNRLSYAVLFRMKLDGQGESWVGTINFALTIFIVIGHLIIIITHSFAGVQVYPSAMLCVVSTAHR